MWRRFGTSFVASMGSRVTLCEEKVEKQSGMDATAEGDFHGLFPQRQLWQPKRPYPLWDNNWDGRELVSTGDKEEDKQRARDIRKKGVTRHIVLVRHGQYDETHKEDEKRVLTPLGREQAELTGKRLAEMVHGGAFGPCRVRTIYVSGLKRARETAEIIHKHLPGVKFEEPDKLLNEGRPCHHIPGGKVSEKTIEQTDDNHKRIEEAYGKYFYRAPTDLTVDQDEDEPKHEFIVVVCHANVIRYFLMRALQLPPEAWLRYCPFNCSLTYVTIRSTGSVSCRMLGDIGHLPYDKSTFSQHEGFNW